MSCSISIWMCMCTYTRSINKCLLLFRNVIFVCVCVCVCVRACVSVSVSLRACVPRSVSQSSPWQTGSLWCQEVRRKDRKSSLFSPPLCSGSLDKSSHIQHGSIQTCLAVSAFSKLCCDTVWSTGTTSGLFQNKSLKELQQFIDHKWEFRSYSNQCGQNSADKDNNYKYINKHR